MRKIVYCKTCLMPNTRPRIEFDEHGVCNACNHNKNKRADVDWEARREELESILAKYRSSNGEWDCVVPWSGGKDSSVIAYKLKFEFGMNPLLVTFSPQVPTEVGNHNREMLIQAGFDHIFFRPDQKIHRHLSRRFFIERGNQKIAWDAGINAVPVKIAVKFGIPLVFYAEHGESEYGGKVLSEEHQKSRDFTEVLEHQIGDDPRNWVDDVVDEKDLNPYIYPEADEIERLGLKAYYFGYFTRWNVNYNFDYIKDKIDFWTCPEGRTEGTFTDFDSLDDKSDSLYYYMQFIKFGFGRAVRDASRMIYNGRMSRDEALELARKYDDEFPSRYFQDMLDYLSLSREEFFEIIDKHRNSEIWEKDENYKLDHGLAGDNVLDEIGAWKLRFPLV